MSATREVFEMLKGLKGVSTSAITGVTDGLKTMEPDSSLLHRWEPDFMDGYELETVGGHKLTKRHIWDAYVAGENILLTGPSGTGKSTMAFHLLDQANEPIRVQNRKVHQENLRRIKSGGTEDDLEPYTDLPYKVQHYSCKEGTRSEELIGTVTIRINKDGSREPVVVRGAVTEAWTQGHTLILEEMDFAPPGVWGECHQFFDGRTQETTVYINGPERIKKHDRFRLIATANTLGQGENQIDFAGTQILNKAFLNRFTYIVKLGWLPMAHEIELVHNKTGLGKAIISRMVSTAGQTRESHEEQVIDACISTRDLLKWSRECRREEERWVEYGESPSDLSADDYWQKIVLPSSVPAFLNGIADSHTQEVYERFLSIR